MTKRKLNSRQAQWTELLAEYDFTIEYCLGQTNPADEAVTETRFQVPRVG